MFFLVAHYTDRLIRCQSYLKFRGHVSPDKTSEQTKCFVSVRIVTVEGALFKKEQKGERKEENSLKTTCITENSRHNK